MMVFLTGLVNFIHQNHKLTRMSSLQDILHAVGSNDDGSEEQEYRKTPWSTGEGFWYVERMLALVFLRCLNRGLLFQLSVDNGDAVNFDDVALVWRPEGHPEAHALLVQIKHKTSPRHMTIHSQELLSKTRYSGFGLHMYCASYEKISYTLSEMDRVTVVLMTNASLGDSSRGLFELQDVGSVPGLELLNAGGKLYKLNPDNQQVREAVHGNTSFMQHFYLLCSQRNCREIVSDIYRELEELLGAGHLCRYFCDSFSMRMREWMSTRRGVCLTSGWSKWQALVDDYVRNHVTECIEVSTRLRYCDVAAVQSFVESHNPAWVRPPETGTESLSATKIHQAISDDRHIMVPVKLFSDHRHKFSAQRNRILHCWGTLCRWLVIVDDGREGHSEVLYELMARTGIKRRLVIVSSRESNGFIDSCQSSDVSDDSWKECLDVSVRLEGSRSERRLQDLVVGADAVKSLKALLEDEPALLLALAQRMRPPPDHYSPKELVDSAPVPVHLLSSLGFRDVCVTDSIYYESLKLQLGRHSVTSFADVGSWIFTPSKFDWPLVVLADNLNYVQEKISRWPIFRFHIISYLTGQNATELPGRLDTASNETTVDWMGNQTMFSDVTKQTK